MSSYKPQVSKCEVTHLYLKNAYCTSIITLKFDTCQTTSILKFQVT